MDKVREITLNRHPLKVYPLRVGDTAKVHIKIKEGSKERIQVFEGVVLKIQGKDYTRTFTIRKISQGIGVEKTIPLASPNIQNIEVLSRAKVRRARLFFLRKLKGRSARLNFKHFSGVIKEESGEEKKVSHEEESSSPKEEEPSNEK